MKVLAIDPSTTSLGWAILEQDADGEESIDLLDFGGLQFDGSETLLDRLNAIWLHFFKILSDHSGITDIMIEKTWKVDRGTIALAAAIKILKETAELMEGISVHQELAVRVRAFYKCGARNSDVAKEKVRVYVTDMFEMEENLVSDVYDAIILGLYCLRNYGR